MNLKTTVGALVLLLGMWAFWHFYEVKGGESRQAAADSAKKIFKDLKVDAINDLQTHPDLAPPVHLVKSGQDWNLDEPVQAKADQLEAKNLAQRFADLQQQELIADSPTAQDLAEYGLASPTAWASFKGISATAGTLWFGIKNPSGAQVYVRSTAGPQVYLVSGWNESSFVKKTADLRDRGFWSLDSGQVTEVDSTFKDARFDVRKQKGGGWILAGAKPGLDMASADKVEGLINDLNGWRVKDFTDDLGKNPGKYGLGPGSEAVKVYLAGAKEPLVLLKGKQDKAQNEFYARLQGNSLIFTLDKYRLDSLKTNAGLLADKSAFAFKPYQVDKFVVEAGGNSRTVEKKNGDWARVPALESISGTAKPDYEGFVDSLGQAQFSALVRPKAQLEGKDVLAKVTL